MNISDRCLQFVVFIATVASAVDATEVKAASVNSSGYSTGRCEGLFRSDSVLAVVSDRSVFDRDRGLKTLKSFFGIGDGGREHVTMVLELSGQPVTINSVIDGVSGRETNSLAQPKSSLIVDLVSERAFEGQDFAFRIFSDHIHSIIEFSESNQINGTPSKMEKAISAEISAHMRSGGAKHLDEAEELTNTLRDLVTIQQRGSSLEVEIIRTLSSTQFPVRGDFVTDTIRFTKDASGKLSRVQIIRRDSPHDQFYQSWTEDYAVTRTRVTERL